MDRVAFTYGSLLSEKVLLAVLGRVPERIDVRLKGFSRAPIRDQCYPAVYKTNDASSVEGKALLRLTDKELEILDKFENPAYNREFVAIETADGTTLNARVWTWPEGSLDDLTLGVDWDYDRFREHFEEEYVEQCSQWAATLSSS